MIGGYRVGSTWRWSDGSAWSYTNWHSGQPDNYGGRQDKTQFNWGSVGKWDDLSTTDTRPFICQIKLGGKLGNDKKTNNNKHNLIF